MLGHRARSVRAHPCRAGRTAPRWQDCFSLQLRPRSWPLLRPESSTWTTPAFSAQSGSRVSRRDSAPGATPDAACRAGGANVCPSPVSTVPCVGASVQPHPAGAHRFDVATLSRTDLRPMRSQAPFSSSFTHREQRSIRPPMPSARACVLLVPSFGAARGCQCRAATFTAICAPPALCAALRCLADGARTARLWLPRLTRCRPLWKA